MPGPSTDSSTNQTRGAATPQEIAFGNMGLSQSALALANMSSATQNPLLLQKTISSQLQAQQREVDEANTKIQDISNRLSWGYTIPNATEQIATLEQQRKNGLAALDQLRGQKELLPEQVKQYESQQGISNAANQRLQAFLTGKDIGVSDEERALITQGISGISQDVATTRGLNRTDVPVMQAIAPTVASALLNQANAQSFTIYGYQPVPTGHGLVRQAATSWAGWTEPCG